MARESRAGETEWLASAAAAILGAASSADSSRSEAWAASTVGSVAGTGSLTPFTMRRVANPRYRPPMSSASAIAPGAQSRLRTLDHFRGQIFHQTSGGGGATQWEAEASQQYRNEDALTLGAAGARRFGKSQLNSIGLRGRRGPWEGSVMDASPFAVGRTLMLQRLRGAVVRFTDPNEARWMALGGVPTPVPGTATPRLALGGAAFENVRFDEAELHGNLFAFWRAAPPAAPGASLDSDTLPGRGAAGQLGWRAPAVGGVLSGRLGAQLHSLDGRRALAAQHAIEWAYQTREWVASVSDERGTRRARLLATDRFTVSPRSEDRWNLQHRFAGGRAETHLTGVVREGGEAALATRTLQLGGSGGFGNSGWYLGADAIWDHRAFSATEERRLSLYGGGLLARGHALLARLEHTRRSTDRSLLAATGEASLAIERGARLGLEPRLAWDEGQFRQGDLATRFSWPFGWFASRITASVTVGAAREDRFRGQVREASLALSLVPRLRDRADLEVRRLDSGGPASMEYHASYDAFLPRYEPQGPGWFAGRDTGRVTVRVVRSGNGSGVADILVSLDGQSLRFTDADGVARFDRVPPGVHVVAIEERSLPLHHSVIEASRAFVTVESGRAPEPVRFTVARSERRTKF